MALVIIPQQIDRVDHVTIQIAGIYTDESTFKVPFSERFVGNVTPETIRARMAGIVTAEASQDIVAEQLTLGVPFDLTPDPPSQDQVDKVAFTTSVASFRSLSAALSWGLADQSAVDAAKADVVKNFKPGYEPLLPMLGINGLV